MMDWLIPILLLGGTLFVLTLFVVTIMVLSMKRLELRYKIASSMVVGYFMSLIWMPAFGFAEPNFVARLPFIVGFALLILGIFAWAHQSLRNGARGEV